MLPWLDAVTPAQRYQAIGVSIAIVLLLLYLIVRAIQTRNKKRRQNASQEHPLPRKPFGWFVRLLVGVVLCIALIGFGYYYFLAARAQPKSGRLIGKPCQASIEGHDRQAAWS